MCSSHLLGHEPLLNCPGRPAVQSSPPGTAWVEAALACSLQALQCAQPSLHGRAHPHAPHSAPACLMPCSGCAPGESPSTAALCTRCPALGVPQGQGHSTAALCRTFPHHQDEAQTHHLPCSQEGYAVPTISSVGLCPESHVNSQGGGRDQGQEGNHQSLGGRHPPLVPALAVVTRLGQVCLRTRETVTWTRHAVYIRAQGLGREPLVGVGTRDL